MGLSPRGQGGENLLVGCRLPFCLLRWVVSKGEEMDGLGCDRLFFAQGDVDKAASLLRMAISARLVTVTSSHANATISKIRTIR